MKVLDTAWGGEGSSAVAPGDLNGDGILDLALGSTYSGMDRPGAPEVISGPRTVLGKGDGTFVAKASYPVTVQIDSADAPNGRYGGDLAVADFNQDGVLDLVTISSVVDSVSVRLGVGDGSFLAGVDYGMGEDPARVLVADINVDGKPDLATSTMANSVVNVRFGVGDGTFGERVALPAVSSGQFQPVNSIQFIDWNQDGLPDLLVTDDRVHILLGIGSGAFAKPLDCAIPTSDLGGDYASAGSVAADFDQDGIVDLAVGNGALFGMNGCSFDRAFDHEFWWPLLAGDFDGDGRPDLVATTTQAITLVTTRGAADFADPIELFDVDCYPAYFSAVSGDLNGDGRLDLVVSSSCGSLRVLLNTCQ